MRYFGVFLLAGLIGLGSNFADARPMHGARHLGNGSQASTTTPRDVRTMFFSVTLPEGWVSPTRPQKVQNGVHAIFTKGRDISLAVTCMRGNASAKELAESTAANMRKDNMEVSEPVADGPFYVIDIKRKDITGKAWFGATGANCAVTTIFGDELAEANPLLQAIKPVQENLIPREVK